VATGLIASAAALVLACLLGLVWRARNGRVRASIPTASAAGGPVAEGPVAESPVAESPVAEGLAAAQGLTAADIGSSLGSRATLVQFSTAFCSPCRATRRILADVAAMVEGVRHVEIDAESRLDLVRRLDVRRTPTTFVLGPDGQVTHRASGQPRKAEVIAALDGVI